MVFFEVLLSNMQPIILKITVQKGGFHRDATKYLFFYYNLLCNGNVSWLPMFHDAIKNLYFWYIIHKIQ